MNMFEKQFKIINSNLHQQKLQAFLESQDAPCMESRVLRHLCPELDLFSVEPVDLFKIHFELFHLLYNLQGLYFEEGKYLHVHFMRIHLTRYPDLKQCRFYDEYEGLFCKCHLKEVNGLCDVHSKFHKDDDITELSAKYFYLDLENYKNFSSESYEKLLNGSLQVFKNFKEYEQGLKLLKVSAKDDIETIKKSFYKLAKQYHPDKGEDSEEMFKKINNAYHLLLRCKGE